MRVIGLILTLTLLAAFGPASLVLSGSLYEAFTLVAWGGALLTLAQLAHARRDGDVSAEKAAGTPPGTVAVPSVG